MTLIHLFGAQTPAGESLKQLLLRKSSFPLIAYSRSNPSLLPADFSDPASSLQVDSLVIRVFGLASGQFGYLPHF